MQLRRSGSARLGLGPASGRELRIVPTDLAPRSAMDLSLVEPPEAAGGKDEDEGGQLAVVEAVRAADSAR